MTFVTLLAILSCIACATLLGVMLTRDLLRLANRLAITGFLCVIFWSLCEALLATTNDRTTALWLTKLAMLGWLPWATLLPHIVLAITCEFDSRAGKILPAFYTLTGVFLLLDCLTPWIHRDVTRETWGWSVVAGPVFPLVFFFQACTVYLAIHLCLRAYRNSLLEPERDQARWFGLFVGAALLASATFDSILPILGVPAPRVGHLAIALIAGLVLWSFQKFGYELFSRGTYAREIIEMLPNGIALLYPDGRIRRVNGAFETLVQCSSSAILQRPIQDFFPAFPLEARETLREFECLLKPHATQNRVDSETLNIPVALSSSVLTDRTNTPFARVVIVRDLREIHSLQRQLVISGRLAAVGELAAGVAHEINNPLSFMRSNLSLLKQYWQRILTEVHDETISEALRRMLDEGDELISETIEGTERTASIIQDIQRFSHPGNEEFVSTDLNELLREAIRIASPRIRKKAKITTQFGDIPFVPASPQEMRQVFLNLLINAGHAIQEQNGEIQVSTQKSDDAILIRVADNGCGIAPNLLGRIFDPFFTTKPIGQGTGLGLGISYRIVHKHGGEIVVESTPDQGSSFCIRLPLERNAQNADVAPEPRIPSASSMRVAFSTDENHQP